MDLFALDIGAEFHDITGFETGVGGSPVNIAIGASRLGLQAIAFTAVGADEVGRFVRAYLEREGVDTRFIAIKAERRTGMAVVGVQPPDRFPLLFYREDPADIHLTIDDARGLPLAEARALQISGTALSRGSARDVTLYLTERARACWDGRPSSISICVPISGRIRSHTDLNMRRVMPLCDVIIGTEEEFYAALAPRPERVMAGERVTDEDGLQQLLCEYAEASAAVLISEARRARPARLR